MRLYLVPITLLLLFSCNGIPRPQYAVPTPEPTVLLNEPVPVYSYKIINEFKHDKKAFTQGLAFHNGFLYESTGHKGRSTLRKVELETGKVLQKHKISRDYFAEGMTILGDKVYQLTWQSSLGFVYDVKDF